MSIKNIVECCVCLENKQCATGKFNCSHNEICIKCYYNLKNKICPLCRAKNTDIIVFNPTPAIIALLSNPAVQEHAVVLLCQVILVILNLMV